MKVTFWGCRGSIATSGAAFARVGGNTTCVEVEAAGERIIIDAGTGLRDLGRKMLGELGPERKSLAATMLFTHYHWDHIQGFPFFTPGFLPHTALQICGPEEEGGMTAERALAEQMRSPNFPVPLGAMRSQRTFRTLRPGDRFEVGEVVVQAGPLAHPQGSFGYRIEAEGRVFCFATDTEHPDDGTVDETLRTLADGADLLVYDAQYTPEEYAGGAGAGPSKKRWGHSTWAAAALAARACEVGSLGLFHHDPAHDDAFIGAMERAATSIFPATFATREGLSLSI
jgi:phosphoribosyl 1,2-cyclic phosphodiesterase